MESSKRIEICGGIATGKTSLAKVLGTYVKQITVIHEDFSANPFLELFYTDPARFAFETEITFLLQHFNAIKTAGDQDSIFVCDYSFLLDQAYAKVTLNASQRKAFMTVYAEVMRVLFKPKLLVHLQCPVEVQMERIKKRGRITEKSIEPEYLSLLKESLRKCIDSVRGMVKVIEISSVESNFVSSNADKEYITKKVLSGL